MIIMKKYATIVFVLLLVSTISATIEKEIAKVETGGGLVGGGIAEAWFKDWRAIGVIAILISIVFVAIAYMIAIAFNLRELKVWADSELSQVFISMLILVGIVGLVSLLSTLSSTVASASGVGVTCDEAKEPCSITVAKTYVDQLISVAHSTAFNILDGNVEMANKAYKRWGIQTNTMYTLWLSGSMAKDAGWTMRLDRNQDLFNTLSNILGALYAQRYFLDVIAFGLGPILLLFGILLRTFFFSRRLGGLLLAIAIGILVVYPLLYVLSWLTLAVTTYGENAIGGAAQDCPKECTISPPEIAGDGTNCSDVAVCGNCPVECRENPLPTGSLCEADDVQKSCYACPSKCKVQRTITDPKVCALNCSEDICPLSCRTELPEYNHTETSHDVLETTDDCGGCVGCPNNCRVAVGSGVPETEEWYAQSCSKTCVKPDYFDVSSVEDCPEGACPYDKENQCACTKNCPIIDSCKVENCPVHCRTQLASWEECDKQCGDCPEACRVNVGGLLNESSKLFFPPDDSTGLDDPRNWVSLPVYNLFGDDAWFPPGSKFPYFYNYTKDIDQWVEAMCSDDPRCSTCPAQCKVTPHEYPDYPSCAAWDATINPDATASPKNYMNCQFCPSICRWTPSESKKDLTNPRTDYPNNETEPVCVYDMRYALSCDPTNCGDECRIGWTKICLVYNATKTETGDRCDKCPEQCRIDLYHNGSYIGHPAGCPSIESGTCEGDWKNVGQCPKECKTNITIQATSSTCKNYGEGGAYYDNTTQTIRNSSGNVINTPNCSACPEQCRLNNSLKNLVDNPGVNASNCSATYYFNFRPTPYYFTTQYPEPYKCTYAKCTSATPCTNYSCCTTAPGNQWWKYPPNSCNNTKLYDYGTNYSCSEVDYNHCTDATYGKNPTIGPVPNDTCRQYGISYECIGANGNEASCTIEQYNGAHEEGSYEIGLRKGTGVYFSCKNSTDDTLSCDSATYASLPETKPGTCLDPSACCYRDPSATNILCQNIQKYSCSKTKYDSCAEGSGETDCKKGVITHSCIGITYRCYWARCDPSTTVCSDTACSSSSCKKKIDPMPSSCMPYDNESAETTNCSKCPLQCRINDTNIESTECADSGISDVYCQSPTECSKFCKSEPPSSAGDCKNFSILSCAGCPIRCRTQFSSSSEEEYSECSNYTECSDASCSPSCKPSMIRSPCDGCLSCEEDCLKLPAVRTNCAEVCGDVGETVTSFNLEDFLRAGEAGCNTESDVKNIGALFIPGFVLPLFNIIVTIAFIRVLSPILGGEYEIPGISRLI